MATASASGSSGAQFSWSASWDDVTHDATLQADGTGRMTLVLEQADGRRAVVYFIQPNGKRLPLEPGLDPAITPEAPAIAASTNVVIGSGPKVITNVNLKPFPPTKVGGTGSFFVAGAAWSSV